MDAFGSVDVPGARQQVQGFGHGGGVYRRPRAGGTVSPMPTPELSNELRIVAEVVAKPGQAEKLKAALLGMIGPSTAEAGCRQYELHADREQPGRFVFVERWADAAAFAFHEQTPHYRQLGPAIADLVAERRLSKLQMIG